MNYTLTISKIINKINFIKWYKYIFSLNLENAKAAFEQINSGIALVVPDIYLSHFELNVIKLFCEYSYTAQEDPFYDNIMFENDKYLEALAWRDSLSDDARSKINILIEVAVKQSKPRAPC